MVKHNLLENHFDGMHVGPITNVWLDVLEQYLRLKKPPKLYKWREPHMCQRFSNHDKPTKSKLIKKGQGEEQEVGT